MTVAAAPFAFLEGALDRAEHLRNDPEALAARWPTSRVLLIDDEGRAAVDADFNSDADDAAGTHAGPRRVRGAELGEVIPADALFLGIDAEGDAWFALPAPSILGTGDAPGPVDLRTAAALWPAAAATAFAQARALLHWRARHRHCGACGNALEFQRAGWLGYCAHCTLEHYPRTDPAMIVAVTDGQRLLLGRQASWPERRYSTLAGFVEPGESLEQTVAREVQEESGVRVRACRYLASQPWPFPSSLMLGFIADAEPDIPVVNDELEDARWFTHAQIGAALRGETRDAGVLLSPRLSISRWLIEQWHAQQAVAGDLDEHSES